MGKNVPEQSGVSSDLLKKLEREFDKSVDDLAEQQPIVPVLKKSFKNFQSSINTSDLLNALEGNKK